MNVTPFPYELHPHIPPEGITFEQRWGDRLSEALVMYERVAAECAAAGLPFRRPLRIPNTRRALETAAYVRQNEPEAFPAVDRGLFDAHFVHGLFLGHQEVLDSVVRAAGADPDEARAAVDAGAMSEGVESSMIVAAHVGVTGTPAWLVDGRTLVEGLQPRKAFEQTVAGLHEDT